jgi:cytidine deaminase
MIASGSRQIKHILIASPNNDFCPPCGGCRQKIAEFADDQTEVHLATQDGQIKTVKFVQLLPLAFGLDKE